LAPNGGAGPPVAVVAAAVATPEAVIGDIRVVGKAPYGTLSRWFMWELETREKPSALWSESLRAHCEGARAGASLARRNRHGAGGGSGGSGASSRAAADSARLGGRRDMNPAHRMGGGATEAVGGTRVRAVYTTARRLGREVYPPSSSCERISGRPARPAAGPSTTPLPRQSGRRQFAGCSRLAGPVGPRAGEHCGCSPQCTPPSHPRSRPLITCAARGRRPLNWRPDGVGFSLSWWMKWLCGCWL
jgi:hypothetical protein